MSSNDMGPNSEGMNPSNSAMLSRQRLRWTNELHERFVDAVAQLGGPDSEYFPFQSVFTSLNWIYYFQQSIPLV